MRGRMSRVRFNGSSDEMDGITRAIDPKSGRLARTIPEFRPIRGTQSQPQLARTLIRMSLIRALVASSFQDLASSVSRWISPGGRPKNAAT